MVYTCTISWKTNPKYSSRCIYTTRYKLRRSQFPGRCNLHFLIIYFTLLHCSHVWDFGGRALPGNQSRTTTLCGIQLISTPKSDAFLRSPLARPLTKKQAVHDDRVPPRHDVVELLHTRRRLRLPGHSQYITFCQSFSSSCLFLLFTGYLPRVLDANVYHIVRV